MAEPKVVMPFTLTVDELLVLIAWGKDAMAEFGGYGESNFTEMYERLVRMAEYHRIEWDG